MAWLRQRGWSPRGAAWWAALLVWLTCGYFQNTRPGWNVNSQFALACALAEHGTVEISPYLKMKQFETGDTAERDGRRYSDKSPLTAFLGAPVVWIAKQLTPGGAELNYARARWWATWIVVGGAAGALAGLLTLLLARRGVVPLWAGIGGAGFVLATPLLGYAILFFNYLPAAALAMLGWWWFERALEADEGTGLEPKVRQRRLLGSGVAFGLACWTLNTTALIPLVLTCVLVAWAGWRRIAWRALLPWVIGGSLGFAGHFLYTHALFGSWGSPYQFESNAFFREQMQRGLMGATRPNPLVAWLITFHPYKGLFFWWPVTLLGVLGALWIGLRRRTGGELARAMAVAAFVIFELLLLYNSAYFMWWGGWAYAPRHLIPALPPLALGLAACLRARRARIAFAVLLTLTIVVNISLVALDPQFPAVLTDEYLLNPESVTHWPAPQAFQLRYVWIGWQTDQNLGTDLGLRGPTSLLPLAGLWVVGLALLVLKTRSLRKPVPEP